MNNHRYHQSPLTALLQLCITFCTIAPISPEEYSSTAIDISIEPLVNATECEDRFIEHRLPFANGIRIREF